MRLRLRVEPRVAYFNGSKGSDKVATEYNIPIVLINAVLNDNPDNRALLVCEPSYFARKVPSMIGALRLEVFEIHLEQRSHSVRREL